MTRAQRLAELIKERVSEILHERVADPRIGFTSITDVEVSPDLKFAKIFVSIYGNEEKKEEAMKGLSSATKFIRGELAGELQIKAIPEIIFKRDDSIERGSRVLAIMGKLKEARRKKR